MRKSGYSCCISISMSQHAWDDNWSLLSVSMPYKEERSQYILCMFLCKVVLGDGLIITDSTALLAVKAWFARPLDAFSLHFATMSTCLCSSFPIFRSNFWPKSFLRWTHCCWRLFDAAGLDNGQWRRVAWPTLMRGSLIKVNPGAEFILIGTWWYKQPMLAKREVLKVINIST